jgi:inorganic phosphate transporter, PiT family
VISGGVMGAGAGKKLSAVRWGVAGNIVVAWLLTLPAAAAIGAATYGFSQLFGDGAAGPVLISLLGIAATALAFLRRMRQEPLPA